MMLQLHDGPTMASNANYTPMPDALLVPARDVLKAAINEAGKFLKKQAEAAQEDQAMSGLIAALVSLVTYVAGNWEQLKGIFLNFADTVNLVQFNNAMRQRYNANEYNAQRFNELSRAELEQQISRITEDLAIAVEDGIKSDVAELSRFLQVYNAKLAAMAPRVDGVKLVLGVGLFFALLKYAMR